LGVVATGGEGFIGGDAARPPYLRQSVCLRLHLRAFSINPNPTFADERLKPVGCPAVS
jgi:hypothetical protein